MKPELLAPAGSAEALLAAIRCGADAVYLGGGAFNARAGARNFSRSALEDAGRQCKTHGVKLYFTLNTLLSDRELPQALALAAEAVQAGADAVIVQDIGLLRLLHEAYPELPLHASTQCSVQTAQGMALLKKLGVSRCIVPRELTKAELEALVEKPPLELEAFVHGALCMSVSGQCLLSHALGARSGNRGTCAQPCRLPWAIHNGHSSTHSGRNPKEHTYGLSLKDLSLLGHVNGPPLNRMSALKIEGRLKRPEYVAAAVTAFRHALDGTVSPISSEDLRQAFSRSGFTQGYYKAERGAGMFGTRQKEDAAPPETLRRLAVLYAKEVPRVPVDFCFSGEIGKPVLLTAEALDLRVCVQGEALEPAQSRALAEEDLRKQLRRLGGTQYFAREIRISLPEGAFMPLGQINALRRRALEALEEKTCAGGALAAQKTIILADDRNAAPTKIIRGKILRFLSASQIPGSLPGDAQIFLPCDTPQAIIKKYGAQVTVPAGVFGDYGKILAQLRKAKEAGAALAMAQTLDGVALAREAGLAPVAGEGMNVLNSASLDALQGLGCAGAVLSAEITPGQARGLKADLPIGAMVYGRLALMLLRNCPVKAFYEGNAQAGCKACGNSKGLVDRRGIAFPVRCEGSCVRLYNSRPIWLADIKDKLPGLDFELFSFTTETRGECAEVLRAYQDGVPFTGDFTRGWMNA